MANITDFSGNTQVEPWVKFGCLKGQCHGEGQDSPHSKSRISGSSQFQKHVHYILFTTSFGKWVCRRGSTWEVRFLFLAEVHAAVLKLSSPSCSAGRCWQHELHRNWKRIWNCKTCNFLAGVLVGNCTEDTPMPCVFPLLLLNDLLIYLLSSGLCFFQREEQANFHLLKDCLTRLLLCYAELGWNSRRWAHFSSRSSDLNSSNSFSWFCTHLCWTVLKIGINLLMTNPLLPQKYFQGQLHVLSCLHRERLFSLFCYFKANEPSLSGGQSHHLTKPYLYSGIQFLAYPTFISLQKLLSFRLYCLLFCLPLFFQHLELWKPEWVGFSCQWDKQ